MIESYVFPGYNGDVGIVDIFVKNGESKRGNKQSEVDLVAIVRGKREDPRNKLKLVWDRSSELELEYETIISPTVIPLDEFEKYKNDISYYVNIEKEGMPIGV